MSLDFLMPRHWRGLIFYFSADINLANGLGVIYTTLSSNDYKGGQMFLKSWKPIVTNGGNPQGRDLFLVMKVELQCPVCEEVMAFETQKRALEAGAEFLRDWAAHDILEPKMCPTCGTYSGLPERYQQQLLLAAKQEITAEWLEEEKKKHNLEFLL